MTDAPSKPRAAVASGSATHSAPELSGVRGWLLVICVLSVPHILLSAAIIAQTWPYAWAGGIDPSVVSTERLRLATQAAIMIGNSAGIALILTRNRYTPAYFTLYLPFLLLLFAADPNTSATQAAHAEALGLDATGLAGTEAQRVVRTIVALMATGLLLVYWLRSKRVRVVFGSNGLEALRRRGQSWNR